MTRDLKLELLDLTAEEVESECDEEDEHHHSL